MGYEHSAYLAYGVRVPVSPYTYDEQGRDPAALARNLINADKARFPDLGHMEAGEYDNQNFFLVTSFHEAGYEPTEVPAIDVAEVIVWKAQIRSAIDELGWSRLSDNYRIGWFVVASTD